MFVKKLFFAGCAVYAFFSGVNAAPNGWQKSHKDRNAKVTLTFPVQQANADLVESMFWELSNPKSANYAKYLTFDQVGQLVENKNATLATVQFLNNMGAQATADHPYGLYVKTEVPVHVADAILRADFHVYTHPDSNQAILKTEVAKLPEELSSHVSHVPHISHFPKVKAKMSRTPILGLEDPSLKAAVKTEAQDAYVDPALLIKYYGITNTKVTHGATQCLFEALGQDFDNDDLDVFEKQFGIPQKNITHIIGPNKGSACLGKEGAQDCGEANLDVQYIMGIAQGAETVYWSINADSQDPFYDWAEQISKYSNPPQVISISYGGYEDSSNDHMTVVNNEIKKLGLQGVSVLVSAGDDGVANFGARGHADQCGYNPSFPASSPYVTAVGATQGPESGNPEVVCSAKTGGVITTGGGFSGVFNRPAYQDKQVSAYLSKATAKSGYNANGRGFPDVSVLGYNYVVAIGKQFLLESGTSASAPVFAGMITLINDARIAEGKSPLGFLNQALYSLDATVWNDIVTGNNKCTADENTCCAEGFTAAKGWDPASGLGSPHFANLKSALMNL